MMPLGQFECYEVSIPFFPRDEAIAEGRLIDVSELGNKAGFTRSVAVSRAVWDRYVVWTTEDTCKQNKRKILC